MPKLVALALTAACACTACASPGPQSEVPRPCPSPVACPAATPCATGAGPVATAEPDTGTIAALGAWADGLDRHGGLRLTYGIQVPAGVEPRQIQSQLIRAVRARLHESDCGGARIYWLNQQQVVVDLPGMDQAKAERVMTRLRARGLPGDAVLEIEALFGPASSD
jgi:hypothetical protein